MKTFFQHILTMGIMVVALFLTADSALGQGSMYEKTEYSLADAPILASPLQRMMDGKAPYLIALAGEKFFGIKMETPEYYEEPEDEILIPVDIDMPSDNEGVTDGNAAVSEGNATVSSGNAEEISSGEAAAESGSENAAENAENPDASADGGEEKAAVEQPEEIPVIERYVETSVTDDYFDDALFIGDSRTVGLSEYCPDLDSHATFYAKVSLTIYGLDDKAFVSAPIIPEEGMDIPEDQLPTEKVTVLEALSRKQYSKIYMMLGLNELGSGTKESFTSAYAGVVNKIRELQPDAIIIIQGIMHVTHSKSSHDRVFKNSTINERNEMLKTLADGEHVFYIDMNEATDDENGALGQDLSFDSVHLKAKSYALWYDYLKNHAFVKEVVSGNNEQIAEPAPAENPETAEPAPEENPEAAVEQAPVENPEAAAEQTPAENPGAAEQAPVDNPEAAAEQTPAENPGAAEQAPTENPEAAEQAPVENPETAVEQTPAENPEAAQPAPAE